MLRTVEAVIDEHGTVLLLEAVQVVGKRRALVTIFEEDSRLDIGETALLSEAALVEGWNSPEEDEAWQYLQSQL